MVLSFILWMYGGARAGFYANLRVVERYDEIMEITYPEEVAAFLPGIETLVAGFGIFVVLLAASVFFDRRSERAAS